MTNTITMNEIRACETWSRKNDSPRGVETVSASQIAPGDEVLYNSHFVTVTEDGENERAASTRLALAGLLAVHPDALRDLHDCYGLDACAPLAAYTLRGSFTVNKILKHIAGDGFTAANSKIAICSRVDTSRWVDNFNVVMLDRFGGLDFGFRPRYRNRRNNSRHLDYYYAKCEFERLRKADEAETIVIVQRREYLKPTKPEPKANNEERYKLERVNYIQSDGARFVKSLDLKRTAGEGERVEYELIGRIFYRSADLAQDPADVIDASGYLIKDRRADLKRRAAAIRSERERAKYTETDHSAHIRALRNTAAEALATVREKFDAAKTSNELRAVSDALGRWEGLSSVFGRIERLEAHEAAKEYHDNAEFWDAYKYIIKDLNEWREKYQPEADAIREAAKV